MKSILHLYTLHISNSCLIKHNVVHKSSFNWNINEVFAKAQLHIVILYSYFVFHLCSITWSSCECEYQINSKIKLSGSKPIIIIIILEFCFLFISAKQVEKKKTTENMNAKFVYTRLFRFNANIKYSLQFIRF